MTSARAEILLRTFKVMLQFSVVYKTLEKCQPGLKKIYDENTARIKK